MFFISKEVEILQESREEEEEEEEEDVSSCKMKSDWRRGEPREKLYTACPVLTLENNKQQRNTQQERGRREVH